MVQIQFELNFLPVGIGCAAYVLYWLFNYVVARSLRKAAAKPRIDNDKQKDIDTLFAETFGDDEDLDVILDGEEPELEPDAELSPLHEPPAAGPPQTNQKRRGFMLLALAAALLVADIGLRRHIVENDKSSTNTEKVIADAAEIMQVTRAGPDVNLPTLSAESENAYVNLRSRIAESENSRVLDEEAESLATGQGSGMVPATLTSLAEDHPSVIGNDEVFTVALTRQIVQSEDGGEDDFVRSAYYGTLMVGSPPEPFTVVFDTGSGHLILPSTYCKSETCAVHKRYRRSASTTGRDINHNGKQVNAGQMRDQISVSFGTGEVTGVFVEDVVCVKGVGGGGPARTVDDVIEGEALPPGCVSLRMIAATELSEDPFMSFQFDGILGLSLDGLSQAPEFNFLGVVAKAIPQWSGGNMPHTFAVFLAENDMETSEIALGGWAPKYLTEDLSWGPVHDPEMGHWIIPIRGIRIDNERLEFCDDGTCKAAVDTGTSLLALPTEAFPEMYEALKHPAPLAGHCLGHGPMLHIELEHFTVTLGPRDYARLEPSYYEEWPALIEGNETELMVGDRKARSDLRCLPTLMTLDLPEPLGPKLFILGEPVLRKYYTVYDGEKKQVGFARAKHYQAPSRDDLFVMAAELEEKVEQARPRRRRPTMFDVFRWRKQLR